MLFYSFFKTLVDKKIKVELKNDIIIEGTLHSVDQYLNIKLNDVKSKSSSIKQLDLLKDCFIRGSVIRYVEIQEEDVQINYLEEAARKEAKNNS
eukprot:snap_masked-scaffold_9-processed-gene-13.78-mRNA-1 protein AED:0.04 eAED:0.04 QI:0/-1/0/1/-1/1/1/0/93